MSDNDTRPLANHRKLRSLRLQRTFITDAGIAHLRSLDQLVTLAVSATGITDAGMIYISSVINLWHLTLGGTDSPISEFGLDYLVQLLKLRELFLLGSLRLTDAAVETIARITKLDRLIISASPQLTDTALGPFKAVA